MLEKLGNHSGSVVDDAAVQQGSDNPENNFPGISTPKGGGAIQGIGEKFQANPVTGTGSMTVPIAMSPGRNGFQPQLALSYDSGNGNGSFGLGWSIGVPFIGRKTQKGLPRYHDGQESDVFLLSGVEDLTPMLVENAGNWEPVESNVNGFHIKRYRPRIEGGFAKIERYTHVASRIMHWKVTTRDNITSVYGETAEARIAHPDDAEKVFQWMLEYTYDEKGNVTWYQYKRENQQNVALNELNQRNRTDSNNQLYLKTIKYSPDIPFDPSDTNYFSQAKWHFLLVMDYGEHDATNPTPTEVQQWSVRQDPFSTFRSGFEIRTSRLCQRVLMYHHFENDLGTDPYLVKSTNVTYAPSPIATTISSVQHWCYETGQSPQSYPPVTFQYSQASIDETVHEFGSEDLENLPAGVSGGKYRWVDLRGEGMPGVLIEDQNAWYFKQNLGDENYYKDLPANASPAPEARLGALKELSIMPSTVNGPGNAQIVDVDGDGTQDVLVSTGGLSGYYAQDASGHWNHFKAFESNPNIDWQDPNLRIMDIDGDGFADVIITEDNCFTVYPSLAQNGYDRSFETPKSFEEEDGPNIVFADSDQSIYLADMSGDGLSDIVRVCNGSVCYWPNLGYGRFGRKVSMDNAPWFDHEELFDQRRIRLTDVDGNGTLDLIYIAQHEVRYYPNHSGNAFGEAKTIQQSLTTHDLAQIATVDLLGSGTICLVWSTPVQGDHPPAMKYIDLMGGVKPYLLTEVNNNMGSLTRLKYAPSTKFYLRDERNRTPWITRLPFPVQVVERMELWDEVNRNRFVSAYAYHHGYFDGAEREFRGFGMVEQWDTESFTDFTGEGLFPPGYNATEEILHAAPIHTKTWFHLGFNGYDQHESRREAAFMKQYASEYWNGDASAFEISTTLDFSQESIGLSNDPESVREAARALKGSPLRQEVYSPDGSNEEGTPYVVTENAYQLNLVQPRGSDRRDRDYASFQVIPGETLTHQYERNASDPRVSQQLTLETDEYGQVLKAAAVAYPRRTSAGYNQQDQTLITISDVTVVNEDDDPNFYRLGVPIEQKSYELTGFTYSAPQVGMGATLLSDFNSATEIAYEATPTAGLEKRLLSHSRTIFYDENLSNTPLAFGLIASHALPFEAYQCAFTPGQISGILNDTTTRVDAAVLTEGAYVDLLSDGHHWVPSGRVTFDSSNFYLPISQVDPFGNTSQIAYDSYHFLLISSTDALNNTTHAQNDYRVLQPDLVTDINGNRQAFAFDRRGMATKVAVMGKAEDNDGDTLANPTTEFSYDLFEWMDNQTPNWAHTRTRETHADAGTRWLESYAYSDGLGQPTMVKAKVAPGEAYLREPDGSLSRDGNGDLIKGNVTTRWVGNGRTIIDNKGNPIKQYEPYFSSTPDYETEAELVEYGVTPVIYYDPLGRAVRTELPDDTTTRVVFNPWEQKNYDQNDTVRSSLWYTNRNSPDPTGSEPTDAQERAAFLAAKHDDTPQVVHMDNLGRPFLTVDDNGADGQYQMTTHLDIQGNPLSITDAKGRTSFTYTYNLLGQPLRTTHIDNGDRYALGNVVGNPLRTWDHRDQAFSFAYDQLLRPIKTYVIYDWSFPEPAGGYDKQLISLTVYGESIVSQPEALENNLLGQPYLGFDSAGLSKTVSVDFKGNQLSSERQMALTYQTTPDWSALDGISDPSVILTTAATLLDTEVFSMSNAHDAQNRPISMVKPDNSEVLPTYDEGGQLLTVDSKLRGVATATNFVQAITYNERGQRQFITYGNGSHTTYHYDDKNFRLTRLITTRNSGADIIQDLNYVYDAAGNIVEQVDSAQQTHYFNNAEVTPNGKYEYDALYRLKEAEGRELIGLAAPGASDIAINALPENTTALERFTQQYVYDELGNIEQMIHTATSGNWTRHYHYNTGFTNNYLLSTSGDGVQPTTDEYTYDAHGNMTAMPHLAQMSWDYADRLQSADLGGGGTAYYTYDAGGNRARKVIENGATREERIYLGDWEVYRKTVSSTLDTERETLHLSDDMGRIALADTLTVDAGSTVGTPTPALRYQMSNHLGSATLELDETAAIISYEEYHPFGTSSYRSGRNNAETSLKRYRYVGKERDDETGLYYYGARYYAAWLARFVSVDPLKDDYPHLASYQYASNDPIGDVDIDGLEGSSETPRNETLDPMEGAPGFFIRTRTTNPTNDQPLRIKEIVDEDGNLVRAGESAVREVEEIQLIEEQIFAILFDYFEITFDAEKLQAIVVAADRIQSKGPFSPDLASEHRVHIIGENYIEARRVSTEQRKSLEIGMEVIKQNPVVAAVTTIIPFLPGVDLKIDASAGRDVAGLTGDIIEKATSDDDIGRAFKNIKGKLGKIGKVLTAIKIADIYNSKATKQEILTELVFTAFVDAKQAKFSRIRNNNEGIVFNVKSTPENVALITERLNIIYSILEEELFPPKKQPQKETKKE